MVRVFSFLTVKQYLCKEKKMRKMFSDKTLFTACVSMPVSAMFEFVDKYIYSDWDFARSIVILIVIDTVMSMVKHWKNRDASSQFFWKGTSSKLFVYSLLLITANILANYTVHGDKIGATGWIGDYLCIAMVVRETISIIENSNAIIPWLPKNILKRLKDFSENGEYIRRKENSNGKD